jgi:fumarate reductase flavoprotein subunit
VHSDRNSNPETLETGVAVVGGGGGGLAAAVALAEKGVDVIVLEKRRKLGGNTALAHNVFAAESPVQKRAGFDVLRDDCFRIAMAYAHWRIDPKLVRVWIDKSGDTIRWLEEKGISFRIGGYGKMYLDHRYPPPGHFVVGKKGGGELTNALARNAEKLGARILCETAVKQLITDDEGRVTGVMATRKGGGQLRIMARSVIVATGGYGGNKRLLKKYNPYYTENVKLVGVPCMGDGLLMTTKIGAATEGLGILHIESACATPGVARDLHALAIEPQTIWVNKLGERFVDESVIFSHAGHMAFEAGMAMMRQPDCLCYTLFDERLKQELIETGSTIGWAGTPAGVPQPYLGDMIQRAAEKGKVKIADSWDDIARWIGAKPEVLKATVDEYNHFCDQKHDAFFVKDKQYLTPLRTPPYYALIYYPRNLGTIGGIKINHRMEVVDNEDKPIPGLYAAGQDTGGWQPETYNQILDGSAFSFAINSGRIAGENVARDVFGK